MDINDYNTRLANTRSDYAESSQELRDSYKNDLKKAKDAHELKQNKQQANYMKSKAKLEDTQSEIVQQYSDKVKSEIANRTERYRDGMESQKDIFNKDRRDLKQDMNRRLDNLSATYRHREQDNDAFQNQQLNTTKERYDSRVKDLGRQFNTNINDTKNRAETALKTNTLQQNAEKTNIINEHDSERRGLIKDARVLRGQMQDKQQAEIRNLRDTGETKIKHLKDHQTRTISDIQKTKFHEQDEMQNNFKNLTNKVSANNQKTNKQITKENEKNKIQMEKDFAARGYQMKREMEEKIKGGNKTQNIQTKLDQTVKSYDNRIDNIYENIQNDNFDSQVQKERMANGFSDAIKDQKTKARKEAGVKEKEFIDFRNKELPAIRDRNAYAVGSLKKELRNNEIRHEAQFIKEKSYNKKLVENQRKVFGQSINTLNDKNRAAVSQMQQEHADEKTSYIEQTKINHHNDVEDIKKEHRRVLTAKESSLTERNDNLERKNASIVKQYEAKVKRVQDKGYKELTRVKALNHQQKTEQTMATKRELEMKAREHSVEKLQMKSAFDKRLSKTKRAADTQLERTVEFYEDMIGREREESHRKLQLKTTQSQSNYERLYQQSELEKATMRQQFDDKITEVENSNADAMEEKTRSTRQALKNKA